MKKYLIHKLPLRSAKYKSYVESKTLDVRLQRKQFFYYISKRKKDSTGSNPKTKGRRIYMRTSTNQNNCEIDMQWLILFRCDREREREREVNDIFPVLKICKNMPCLALTTPVCFIHKKTSHISASENVLFIHLQKMEHTNGFWSCLCSLALRHYTIFYRHICLLINYPYLTTLFMPDWEWKKPRHIISSAYFTFLKAIYREKKYLARCQKKCLDYACAKCLNH